VTNLVSLPTNTIWFTEYYLNKHFFCYTWYKSVPRMCSGEQRARVFCRGGRERSICPHSWLWDRDTSKAWV